MKKTYKLLIVLITLLISIIVFAQNTPLLTSTPHFTPPEDLNALMIWINGLATSGQWPMVLGGIIYALLQLVKKTENLWKDTQWAKNWAPIVGLVLAIFTPLATSLISGLAPMAIAMSVALGVVAWVTAMGANELPKAIVLIKRLFTKDPTLKTEQAGKKLIVAGAKTNSLSLADIKGAGYKVYGADGKEI